jgi:hypothetical protein
LLAAIGTIFAIEVSILQRCVNWLFLCGWFLN